MPTIFHKIIRREIPADIVYETDHVIAFRDIEPKAPVHIIIVPKQTMASIAEVPDSGDHQYILNAAKIIAEQEGLKSFRLVFNTGADAGQTVFQLHAHLIGGRPLGDFCEE